MADAPLISLAILQAPGRRDGKLEKGVLLTNQCDLLCRQYPSLKSLFYLVERSGWYHLSAEAMADVKLVDNPETLAETRRLFPRAVTLAFANAEFVDTDLFKPLGTKKPYTGIQIAAWQPFKRHELFVEGAALLPDRRFIMFGHFWMTDAAETALKTRTIALAEKLAAPIDFPFADAAGNAELPLDAAAINRLINRAAMGILTTTQEGLNRFKMECMAADIPFLLPRDANAATKKHINDRTGLLFEPSPHGLAEAILHVERNYRQFSPRAYLLRHSGIRNATAALQAALREIAAREGSAQSFEGIYWNGRNEGMFWGDQAHRELEKCLAGAS